MSTPMPRPCHATAMLRPCYGHAPKLPMSCPILSYPVLLSWQHVSFCPGKSLVVSSHRTPNDAVRLSGCQPVLALCPSPRNQSLAHYQPALSLICTARSAAETRVHYLHHAATDMAGLSVRRQSSVVCRLSSVVLVAESPKTPICNLFVSAVVSASHVAAS